MDPACLHTFHPCTQFQCLSCWKSSIIISTHHFLSFLFLLLLVSYILLLKALANKISCFENRLTFRISLTGLAYKMDSSLLSLALAVVLIYYSLLVHPQPLPGLVPPLPPPPPAPSMLHPPPPPPRSQRDDTLRSPNKTSPSVSSTPPLKKKTIGQHNKLHTNHEHRSPPPSKGKLNLGKKIGLLFVSIVAILQVCVVAFLVVKSRKMFKSQNSH